MWPDRVSNPGPQTYESGAPPIALRGPACKIGNWLIIRVAMDRMSVDAWLLCIVH